MLEVKVIKEDREGVLKKLAVKNFNDSSTIDEIIELEDKRKITQAEMDSLKSKGNNLAQEIGTLFKAGKQEEANKLKADSSVIKEQAKEFESNLNEIQAKLRELLFQVPNLPNELVPSGSTEADNDIIEEYGSLPDLGSNALAHWDLADKYNLIDFELGNKLTGSGFPVYLGKGAKLQRALINFFLDKASEAGYKECLPPIFVKEESAYATGQLPDKEGQMYKIENENLYAIPTAEVPITNIYRNVILKKDDFPIKLTAYTPCFRREAGSYGKDVRGLNRLHQFDKVEIVQLSLPENSYSVLDDMVKYVASLLKELELPFRILRLCGGDLGFTSALTYDFEVYSAAQKKWLEVSSVSNFETYQANRLKLRYKSDDGKTRLAHTLNGSALALPRIVASLLENNQDVDKILIPSALKPYTGFDFID